MRKSVVAIGGLVLVCLLSTTSAAQTCGFPWTLTAIPAGGSSVVIGVCGYYAGCLPHNPQFTVSGSEINITLQSSVPPDRCQCIAVEDTFHESVVVHSLPPGTYTVTATLLSCGAPLLAGSTSFTQSATSAIPMLDAKGMIALVALVLITGIWLLRK
jgi:hypothetical protein